jgi:hypothetical protein
VCETVHHHDCWDYHGGCTTFACPGIRGWVSGDHQLVSEGGRSWATYRRPAAIFLGAVVAWIAYLVQTPELVGSLQVLVLSAACTTAAALMLVAPLTIVRVASLDAADAFLTVRSGLGGVLRSSESTMRLANRGARVFLRSRMTRGVTERVELLLQVPEEPARVLADVPSEARLEVEAFGHRLAHALARPLEQARPAPLAPPL